MVLILNIETSEDYCSVSLADKGRIVNTILEKEERSHASLLAVLIDKLFKESNVQLQEVDAVAISKGPGSYTGLRIGTSTAKGICYGLNKPLIAIDTLKALAWGAKHRILNEKTETGIIFCPMLDARRMEVYTATFDYQLNNIEPTYALILDEGSIKKFRDAKDKSVFCGSGIEKFKTLLNNNEYLFVEDLFPRSDYLAELSYQAYKEKRFEDTAYFEPFYLKEFVATTPKQKVL